MEAPHDELTDKYQGPAAGAADISKSGCGDPDTRAHVATDRRLDGDVTAAPAATQPGNQARVRPVENMLTLSEKWPSRPASIQETEQNIKAEYRRIETRGDEDVGGRTRERGGGKPAPTTSETQKGDKTPKSRRGPPRAAGRRRGTPGCKCISRSKILWTTKNM
ncbi:hypothetical protein ES703_73103 [subsurface metagenome]